jgi:hypothetical protein
MKHQRIDERIADLFEQPLDEHNLPIAVAFIDKLMAAHAEADKAFHWNTFALIAIWAATYAIGAGIITEGRAGPFNIAEIKKALIVMPILLGFFHYRLSAASLQSVLCQGAITQMYKFLFPKVYKHRLDTLLSHPSFISFERIVDVFVSHERKDGEIERKHSPVLLLMKVFFLLIPLVAEAHVSFIVWSVISWNVFLVLGSFVIGATFLLRGYYFIYLNSAVT